VQHSAPTTSFDRLSSPLRGILSRRSTSLQSTCRLALVPGAFAVVCLYGCVLWTFGISLTRSRLLPLYQLAGFEQYRRLFAQVRWWTAMSNLVLYASCLTVLCLLLGIVLAVLIDRATRWRRLYRVIFMLPLSVSFVVTGLVWRWVLDPGVGLEHMIRALGLREFQFDWVVRPEKAIYTLVLAGSWQQTGLCLALLLAGLSRTDAAIWKMASIDGIPEWRVYRHIALPLMRPAFLTAAVLVLTTSVKSYDLVVSLTGGGPGFASDLPGHFVVELINRQELGMGAAGACVLMCTVAAAVAPFVFLGMRLRCA
jgi:glucose/mannose transport system permease protein